MVAVSWYLLKAPTREQVQCNHTYPRLCTHGQHWPTTHCSLTTGQSTGKTAAPALNVPKMARTWHMRQSITHICAWDKSESQRSASKGGWMRGFIFTPETTSTAKTTRFYLKPRFIKIPPIPMFRGNNKSPKMRFWNHLDQTPLFRLSEQRRKTRMWMGRELLKPSIIQSLDTQTTPILAFTPRLIKTSLPLFCWPCLQTMHTERATWRQPVQDCVRVSRRPHFHRPLRNSSMPQLTPATHFTTSIETTMCVVFVLKPNLNPTIVTLVMKTAYPRASFEMRGTDASLSDVPSGVTDWPWCRVDHPRARTARL